MQVLIVGCSIEISNQCKKFLQDAGHSAIVMDDVVEVCSVAVALICCFRCEGIPEQKAVARTRS